MRAIVLLALQPGISGTGAQINAKRPLSVCYRVLQKAEQDERSDTAASRLKQDTIKWITVSLRVCSIKQTIVQFKHLQMPRTASTVDAHNHQSLSISRSIVPMPFRWGSCHVAISKVATRQSETVLFVMRACRSLCRCVPVPWRRDIRVL